MVFSTHFTLAAVEALQSDQAFVWAPLGLLHGIPCHLSLWRRESGLTMALFSAMISRRDDALAAPDNPGWAGQDDAGARRFAYAVLRGTVGAIDIGSCAHYTSTGGATVFFKNSANVLVYDAEGKLQVELEIHIKQHSGC